MKLNKRIFIRTCGCIESEHAVLPSLCRIRDKTNLTQLVVFVKFSKLSCLFNSCFYILNFVVMNGVYKTFISFSCV